MAKPCVKCMAKTPTTRVIEGSLYLRHDAPYAHDIRVHELGHGHTEVTIAPRYGWSEVDSLSPQAHHDYLEQLLNPPELTPLEVLENAARSRDNSTQRAKTNVRRLIKSKNLNQMLTLTYADNVTDRDTHHRNFDVFIKRVKRLLPRFEYVVTHERQERGAWHSHIAVHKILPVYWFKGTLVKSYDVMRHLWRSSHTSGGAVRASRCHEGGRKRNVSFIASYLAKYIGKDIGEEVPRYGNTYSSSLGRPPAPIVFCSLHPDLWGAICEAHDLIGPDVATSRLFEKHLVDKGVYFMSASPVS